LLAGTVQLAACHYPACRPSALLLIIDDGDVYMERAAAMPCCMKYAAAIALFNQCSVLDEHSQLMHSLQLQGR